MEIYCIQHSINNSLALVHCRVMALVDSKAAFDVHCDNVDNTGWLKRTMHGNNLQCFSDLGYSISTPQNPPTEQDFVRFCTQLNNGVAMTISETARVRRLHFEASTMIVAHLKQQATTDASTDGARKLPAAEKQARLLTQQRRLTGVNITGDLQPSYALIDLVNGMIETNAVIWISPTKCSKRDAEIQLTAKEKVPIVSLDNQVLKLTAPEQVAKTDTGTELQLQWALQRRGIALDQCGLVEWNTHQRWVQYLLGLLSKDVPEGYSKIRTDQVMKADKELFLTMAEEIQRAGQRLTANPKPMDVQMQRLITDPRVTMYLLPLPKSSAPAKSSEQNPSSGVSPKTKGSGVNNSPKQPRVKKANKPSSRAKAMCPAELKDYAQVDDQGRAICWSFNLKNGCKEATQNGRCKKGAHICIKCHRSNHGLATCRVGSS